MTTIATARLILRELSKPTRNNLAWLKDPDVVRYSQQRHQFHTLSSQHRYVSSFAGASKLWGIYFVETGEHVGNLSATHDEPNNVCDVGIMIGEKKYWGKGLGREAWKAACDWLISKDGGNMRKLEAGCMRPNVAMLRIISNSGFKQEGELLNHFLLDGAPVSGLLFGRMK
jgi:ribosomal-protein-alanine N-acetyltransferase